MESSGKRKRGVRCASSVNELDGQGDELFHTFAAYSHQ